MITSVSDITSFKWASVMANNPLSIKLDGDTAALALIPDSLVDPLSLSVGDRVRVELSLRKVVVHGVAGGSINPGRVEITAAAAAPAGWLLMRGQSLLRASYPGLYAAIGTTYGTVDSTHFTLPDTRGRVVAGVDTAQTEFDTLGEKGGSKTHTNTVAEMAAHTHTYSWGTAPITSSGSTLAMIQTGFDHNQATGSAGTATPFSMLQPYISLNYIIKF